MTICRIVCGSGREWGCDAGMADSLAVTIDD
jgi:hypothetical protein